MKQIQTYKGLKKGDYLYWRDKDTKKDECVSVVAKIWHGNARAGMKMTEDCYWSLENGDFFMKKSKGLEWDKDSFEENDIYLMDEKEVEAFKLKLVLEAL